MKEVSEKVLGFSRLWVWHPENLEQRTRIDYVKYISYEDIPLSKLFPGFKKYNRMTLIIDLTKSREEIWRDFKKRCRNSITKAEKLGLFVVKSSKTEDYNDFHQAYMLLCRRELLIPHSLKFYKQGDLFLVKQNDKTVSAAIMMKDERHAHQTMQVSMENIHGRNNLYMGDDKICQIERDRNF